IFPVFPRSHIQRLTEGFHKVAVGTKSACLTDLSYRIAGTKQHSGGSLYPEIPEIVPGSHPDTALKTAGTLSFSNVGSPGNIFHSNLLHVMLLDVAHHFFDSFPVQILSLSCFPPYLFRLLQQQIPEPAE